MRAALLRSRIDELLQRRKHLDPLTLVQDEGAAQLEERRLRIASTGMQAFRKALLADGSDDIRESILGDLRGYFTDQYFAAAGPAEEAERDKVAMWSINLLWYAYLQAEGFAYEVQVDIAGAARTARASSRHLDFGSGIGVTSQLFHSLGYEVELADVEEGLLAFARYRLERRGVSARYIHLGNQPLQSNLYDAVTAIDTLSFVPDFQTSARAIRRSMRMGGLLFANFDTRRGVQIGWDILYDDDLRLRRQLHESGFEPELRLGAGVRSYRAVETDGLRHMRRRLRDNLLFPARRLYRQARSLPMHREQAGSG
jgi:hypothetical protein